MWNHLIPLADDREQVLGAEVTNTQPKKMKKKIFKSVLK